MSRMTEKLARWFGLTLQERRIFLIALLLLPMIALVLRTRGLQGLRKALAARDVLIAADLGRECVLARSNAAARMVVAAARYGPYRAKCLPVALTLAWLLRRQGIETNLRLGVRKEAARFEAHAWIEFDGIPLIDGPGIHERFAAFEPGFAIRP